MAAISMTELTKRYGSAVAVDALSLSVDRGEVFGLLGPNGAGKSTTIDMLCGYRWPTSGRIRVLGRDPTTDEITDIRRRTGILPDGVALYDRLTGRQHLEFAVAAMAADDDPEALLERVGLAEDADRRVGDYSKGMCQRLALAAALVGDPDLLVLDEPTSGLDPSGVRELRSIIRAERDRGAGVLFSSHALSQVEAVSDRVGILNDGALVAVDTVDGLREAVDASTTITVSLDRALEQATLDGLDSLEAVEAVTTGEHGRSLSVSCTDSTATGAVLGHLERSSASLRDVSIEEPSLETLFAAYTDDSGVGSGGVESSATRGGSDGADREVMP